MEIVWIVFLTIFIYMAIVLVISGIRTLIAMKVEKKLLKKVLWIRSGIFSLSC